MEQQLEHEIVLRSVAPQWEEFLKSSIWADFQSNLAAWIFDIRNQLESSQDHDVVLRLQGNVEALRRVLLLPESVLFELEQQLKGE